MNIAGLCECGHLEVAHSDGLPKDPNRLCAECRECQGYTPAASESRARQALREIAEIALNRDGMYGDPILAIADFLAGELADEPLGAELAAWGYAR